jgi:uncharacterized membrane protein YvbJ
MKKLNRNVITTSIVLLSLLTFFLFTTMFESKEKVIANFKEAIESKDIEALKNMLHSEDSNFKVNEENVQLFLNYLKDYSKKEEVIEQLRENGKHDIIFIKETKEYFTTKHKLFITPFYLHIQTSAGVKQLSFDNGVTLEINDQTEEIIIPVIPGKYRLSTEFSTAYTSFTNEKDIYLIPKMFNEQKQYTYQISSRKALIGTNLQTVDFYVNGERFSSEIGLHMIDPVIFDGSISVYAQANLPGGTATSEVVTVTSKHVDLQVVPNEELSNVLKQTVNDYILELQKAVKDEKPDFKSNLTSNFKAHQEGQIIRYGLNLAPTSHKVLGEDAIVIKQINNYYYNNRHHDSMYEVLLWAEEVIDGKTGLVQYTLVFDEETKEWLIDWRNVAHFY